MAATLRERQKLRTYEEIREAAWQLSETKGMASTKLSEIAERAGVSEQTLFNHFPSKDDLILALLDDWVLLDSMREVMLLAPEHLGPADALMEMARQMEWPDVEAEEQALRLFRITMGDPQLLSAYLLRQRQATAAAVEALAPRARRHRVTKVRLELLCACLFATANAVAAHQTDPLTPGRWRRELLRELNVVMAGFR